VVRNNIVQTSTGKGCKPDVYLLHATLTKHVVCTLINSKKVEIRYNSLYIRCNIGTRKGACTGHGAKNTVSYQEPPFPYCGR
jgi:hypothetical protein